MYLYYLYLVVNVVHNEMYIVDLFYNTDHNVDNHMVVMLHYLMLQQLYLLWMMMMLLYLYHYYYFVDVDHVLVVDNVMVVVYVMDMVHHN